MIKILNESLNKEIEVDRVIGSIIGEKPGPTVIMIGGIHGNEKSGVFALHQVFNEIKNKSIPIAGSFYALCGNLQALGAGKRFIEKDLNRMWTVDEIDQLVNNHSKNPCSESAEQSALFDAIHNILKKESGPFYFMDLHTTSCETIPFVMVNDTMMNRKFTQQYPIPMILGIEEHLDGALLSYINELGYVAFGFEAGQHDDLGSLENQIAFIYLSLVLSGLIAQQDIDYNHYYNQLAKTSTDLHDVFEICYRVKIEAMDTFQMRPGFVNFQKLKKGEELATKNDKVLIAAHSGRVFMPKYQHQGDDGFFEIRRLRRIFLQLSEVLRKIRADKLIALLPGIRWQSEKHDALLVNLKIARFFARSFFHLLGYRNRKIDKNHLVAVNREDASRTHEYSQTPWMNN